MAAKYKKGDLVETLVKSKTRGSMYWLPARVIRNENGLFDLKISETTADRFGIHSLNKQIKAEKIRGLTAIKVGTEVRVDENKDGIVRWMGKDKIFGNLKYTWYGIELKQARGFSDGVWKGKRFFECNRWCGMFVKRERLMVLGVQSRSKPKPAPKPQVASPGRSRGITVEKDETVGQGGVTSSPNIPKTVQEKSPYKLSLGAFEEEKTENNNANLPVPYTDPQPSVSPRLKTEEEREIRKTFKFFDKNHDKKIDAKELKNVMKELGSEIDDLGVKLLMEDFDVNKNGTIEWSEFLVMMKQLGGIVSS